MRPEQNKIIILFDGVCNLCNGAVRFLIQRDKKEIFRFASIQSDAAKNILLQYQHKNNELNSILVIDRGEILEESNAVCRIFSKLKAPWSWLCLFCGLPRSWRDHSYRFIANRRYKWFGKKNRCTYSMDKYENRFIL